MQIEGAQIGEETRSLEGLLRRQRDPQLDGLKVWIFTNLLPIPVLVAYPSWSIAGTSHVLGFRRNTA